MEQDLELIDKLADGRFHSGAGLGEALGISRAAIWKRVQRLAEFGVEVESVRGKGYRLSHPLSLIDRQELEAMLPAGTTLVYTPITGSTNVDALALAAEGARLPLIVTTECQNAGRGRRGRRWQSPFAASLYLSVLYRLNGGFASLGGLSLAAGVAVSEALARLMPGLDVGLKWPNDLLVGGAKLGGVLIELAGEIDGQVEVVVGVGINVTMREEGKGTIDQPWTDLARLADTLPSRTRLAGEVAASLIAMLDQFAASGFAPFMEAFERRDLSRDQPVAIYSGEQRREGIARGVSEDGALRVEMGGTIHELYGGEVSLRLQ